MGFVHTAGAVDLHVRDRACQAVRIDAVGALERLHTGVQAGRARRQFAVTLQSAELGVEPLARQPLTTVDQPA